MPLSCHDRITHPGDRPEERRGEGKELKRGRVTYHSKKQVTQIEMSKVNGLHILKKVGHLSRQSQVNLVYDEKLNLCDSCCSRIIRNEHREKLSATQCD